jgi:hypothetical protein
LGAPFARWFTSEEEDEDDMEGALVGGVPSRVVKFTGSNRVMTVSELRNLVYQKTLAGGSKRSQAAHTMTQVEKFGCCGSAAMGRRGFCSTTISSPGLTATGSNTRRWRRRTCSWRHKRGQPGNGPTMRIQLNWRPGSRPKRRRRRRRRKQQRLSQPPERERLAHHHQRHQPQLAQPPKRPYPRFSSLSTM